MPRQVRVVQGDGILPFNNGDFAAGGNAFTVGQLDIACGINAGAALAGSVDFGAVYDDIAFAAVGGESVDPSQKACILAEGISEAMNCTAFGLLSAIVALMGFAFLNGKTQTMEDDINEASVQVLNLVVANRQKVNLQGIEG
jgi:hypothetical protein